MLLRNVHLCPEWLGRLEKRLHQLDEVRALGRPPSAVQSTMEMVCVMIGEKTLEWSEIRKVIKRDDFVSTVVNFDPMFRVWELEFAGARTVLSDLEKRKNIKLKFKTTPEHASLQERLRVLSE